MIIAIVGSREFKDEKKVHEIVFKEFFRTGNTLLTGGARGVDKWAQELCVLNRVPLEIIRPLDPADKFSYLLRNAEIVAKADKIIAFWDGKSKGTKFVIDYASRRKVPLQVFKDEE